MSHPSAGPLAAYNSLTDKHLTGYFNNTRIRRHLRRVGLVTRSGRILSEKEYRLNSMRKDHQKYIRECLAQAIFHKVLDMERHHQIEIKRKLETFAQKERVQKIKVDRSRRLEEDGMPLFSPRPPMAPKSSYGRNTLHDGERLDSSESPSSSRPNTAPGNMQRPIRLEPLPAVTTLGTVPKTTSATQPKSSALELDHQLATGVDKDLMKLISTVDQASGISPYRLPIINNYVTPVPPPPKKSDRNPNATRSGTLRGRLFRPTTAPHGLDQLSTKDHGKFQRTPIHSNVAVTMLYLGKTVHLSHDDMDYKDDIKVFQQHCGGENLCIYKGSLLEGDTFQCISRRHRGFPFSLTFYINGIQVDRLSSCCEYKHRKGARLGGKHGYFKFVNIEGASPCYRCIIAMGLDKKPSPPPKKRKEEHDDEDYEDPKVETMMGNLNDEEQCTEEVHQERALSPTSSAYGADRETSDDKTEMEEDDDDEVIEDYETKEKHNDENEDTNKDEYDEDFEVDEDKTDEKVNEEGQVDKHMNGNSKSPLDDGKDDLDLEKQRKNSSKKAPDASDSEKDERDGYSDNEFEEELKQDRRKESLISSSSTLYNSTSRDESEVEEERVNNSEQEDGKRTYNKEIPARNDRHSGLNTYEEKEDQIQTEESADENSPRREANTVDDESEVHEGADDYPMKENILKEEELVTDRASQNSHHVVSRKQSVGEEVVMAHVGNKTEAESINMEPSEVDNEGDSKSIQEKIAEAIGNTTLLNSEPEPEPSDSSTDEEDNLISTAHDESEGQDENIMADGSEEDMLCLERALEKVGEPMDIEPQMNQMIVKETCKMEYGEAKETNIVTEIEATLLEETSEDISPEMEELEEEVDAVKQGTRQTTPEVVLIMEEETEEQKIIEEREPIVESVDDVKIEEEEAVNIIQVQPLTEDADPRSDTDNVFSEDKIPEGSEPVVENEVVEAATEGEEAEEADDTVNSSVESAVEAELAQEVLAQMAVTDQIEYEVENTFDGKVIASSATLDYVVPMGEVKDLDVASRDDETANEAEPDEIVPEIETLVESIIHDDEKFTVHVSAHEEEMVNEETLKKDDEAAEEIIPFEKENTLSTTPEAEGQIMETAPQKDDEAENVAYEGELDTKETALVVLQAITETVLHEPVCDDEQVNIESEPEREKTALDVSLEEEAAIEDVFEVGKATTDVTTKQVDRTSSEEQVTVVGIESEGEESIPQLMAEEEGGIQEINEVAVAVVQGRETGTETSCMGAVMPTETSPNDDKVNTETPPEVEPKLMDVGANGMGDETPTTVGCIDEEEQLTKEPLKAEEAAIEPLLEGLEATTEAESDEIGKEEANADSVLEGEETSPTVVSTGEEAALAEWGEKTATDILTEVQNAVSETKSEVEETDTGVHCEADGEELAIEVAPMIEEIDESILSDREEQAIETISDGEQATDAAAHEEASFKIEEAQVEIATEMETYIEEEPTGEVAVPEQITTEMEEMENQEAKIVNEGDDVVESLPEARVIFEETETDGQKSTGAASTLEEPVTEETPECVAAAINLEQVVKEPEPGVEEAVQEVTTDEDKSIPVGNEITIEATSEVKGQEEGGPEHTEEYTPEKELSSNEETEVEMIASSAEEIELGEEAPIKNEGIVDSSTPVAEMTKEVSNELDLNPEETVHQIKEATEVALCPLPIDEENMLENTGSNPESTEFGEMISEIKSEGEETSQTHPDTSEATKGEE